MASIPGIKGGLATSLSFPQTLRAVDAALAAAKSSGGITGVSKVTLALETIDAILKATETAPGDHGAARPDGHQRFDLDEALDGPNKANDPSDLSTLQRVDTEALPDRPATSDTAETAPGADPTVGRQARDSGPDMPGPATPEQRVVGDPGPNLALLREAAGVLLTGPRATKRSRLQQDACPRCGRERTERRCACRPLPRPPARR